MQTTMDLDLVKFINSDLTWRSVKKGHRTMKRRPKKPAPSSSDFDYEKSGVAILGQHFGEEVVDVPIKKRILMLQSPSPSNEKIKSTQKHSTKSKTRSINSDESKLIEKEVVDLNDFSGIELLATAACHSSVCDSPAPMESCPVEDHTTPSPDGVKDDIAPVDSDESSVHDNVSPVTQSLEIDKKPVLVDVPVSVPSNNVKFHWDLNVVMDDEWEEPEQEQEQEQDQEPCCDILVDPHSEKVYETTNSEGQQQVKSDAIDKCDGRQAVSEVVQGGCQDDKVSSEDRLSDCCGSNSVEKVKLGGGYESPVEDGELRDTWQKENEVEEMECVDYESDNIYEDNFDTIESSNNETIGEQDATLPNNEVDKKDVPSISNQLPEHSQSAISQEKDRNRNRTPAFGVHKNDSCIRRNRSENIEDCYSRGKRDYSQEKSMGRCYQARGRWDDSPIGGWDSRNSHSHNQSQRFTKKHVIGGSSIREANNPLSYNQRSTYKTFNTRPERNESYGVHRGITRDFDKYKGGLGFHPQVPRREDYNERKVTSFSPNVINRGAHVPRSRRRSRSRSRSESPIAWNFQKKRHVDTTTKREGLSHNINNRDDVRIQGDNINGQYRDMRENYNVGRLKTSDHFSRSGRYPQQPNGQYGMMMNGEGRFRYHDKDNGFRYSRNENR